MASADHARVPPRDRIARESRRVGERAVVDACVALRAGREADEATVMALGGPAAPRVLAEPADGPNRYWLRVWAVRGLLYVWDDAATATVRSALADDAWRVREGALRVMRRRLLGDLVPDAARLAQADPVPRVREAARRALVAVTAAGS